MDAAHGAVVLGALVRQWRLIAGAIPSLDLDAPSRVDGWRNREVVAHLTMQPALLERFLTTAGGDAPQLDVAENLSGTRNLAGLVDTATRDAAAAGRVDFAGAAERAIVVLAAADLSSTVTTLQGPILLVDYLVTRCVEAVVHGGDLNPPVPADPVALDLVAGALTVLLGKRAPELVTEAGGLDPLTWVDIATGRAPSPRAFSAVVPLMG